MSADTGSIPTRESLLNRLKDWGDERSWSEFFETYWRLIYNVGIKAGLTDAEAQDVVQETVLSLAKNMPGFIYDRKLGSFKGYLLRLTRWRIVDQMRKRGHGHLAQEHTRDEPMPPDLLDQIPDPEGVHLEALWNEEWEQHLMEQALERVRRRANPKDFQLFDLYARKNWAVAEIVQAMEVSVHQVYTAKSRILALLKKEVQHLRKTEELPPFKALDKACVRNKNVAPKARDP